MTKRIQSGTNYFTSEKAAILFFTAYGIGAYTVRQKIVSGEIHIGVPPTKRANERAVLIEEDGRYVIERDLPTTGETDNQQEA